MHSKIIYLLIGFITLLSGTAKSQDRQKMIADEMEVVKKVADNIVNHTSYAFIDKSNNQRYASVKGLAPGLNLEIESPYTTWHYWNGLLNLSFLSLSEFTGDKKYASQVEKFFEFAFTNRDYFSDRIGKVDKWSSPFAQSLVFEELDDCGALGASLVQFNETHPQKNYQQYIDSAANHIMKDQQRLVDGTLVRGGPHKYTLWGDDLFMSVPFMARMGAVTGDQQYFNDAAHQVIQFKKYLFNDNKGLYYHCYYSDNHQNGVALWGRCNGWIIMAQVELLKYLPVDHPDRNTLLSILQNQVINLSRYQDKSGLWHQLLDKNDSYLETSASAMFVYGIAKAINNGWLDKRYASIALQGWKGLKTKIRDDGQVEGICAGTWIQDDLLFYYNRPTPLQDIHGLGAIIMAGVEVMKMLKDEEIQVPNY